MNEQLKLAADCIRDADGILIAAGAGMGVDSGMPDFRGTHGFWNAYPALKTEDIGFQDIANGEAFQRNPTQAWGFYGHRLNLYRRTVPHAGFDILRHWSSEKDCGAFVFTSNVDGHFQKAGFPENRVLECHGSTHRLQCSRACSHDVWSADELHPEVDEEQCLLTSPLPRCPKCGSVARPNILMFNDWDWIETRAKRQRMRFEAWLLSVERLVVIELGAGRAIPTVRNMSERNGPRVIRINTDEYAIDPKKGVGLQGRALDLLKGLDGTLRHREGIIAPRVPSPGSEQR
jgi:NAD-dependent SIR2 family protein deacetylase